MFLVRKVLEKIATCRVRGVDHGVALDDIYYYDVELFAD